MTFTSFWKESPVSSIMQLLTKKQKPIQQFNQFCMHKIENQITTVCERKIKDFWGYGISSLSSFLFRCHTYDYLNVNCHLILFHHTFLFNLHYIAVWFPWRLCCIIYIISGIGGCCETGGKILMETNLIELIWSAADVVQNQFEA